MTFTQNSRVLIVGAGCFGLSTCYHLLNEGCTDVTVIDRSATVPAPDAASYDINKIVRTSYADEFYATLAHEAIQHWRDDSFWQNVYRQSGVLILDGASGTYGTDAYQNDVKIGSRLVKLEGGEAVRAVFPKHLKVGSFEGLSGYLNYDGGWADATKGISLLMSKVVELGGKIHTGKCAVELIRTDGKTSGVKCADGMVFRADVVILSTGSWTGSSFPDLRLKEHFLATGQSLAMIQLTEDAADAYRTCPVVLDLSSGFYVFPPNDQHIVKMAIHTAGYTHASASGKGISTPRTMGSHGDDGLRIPKSALQTMRRALRDVYPELASQPFCGTRLCWYADTPDADWLIGFHPSDPCLMLATGGSGHAYKFLPVIGRLIVEALRGTMDPAVAKKFAVGREHEYPDSSRPHVIPEELDVAGLCTPEDLLPSQETAASFS